MFLKVTLKRGGPGIKALMNDPGSKDTGAKTNPRRDWRLTFPFPLTDKIVGEQESPPLLSFMTGASLQRR